MDLFLTLDEVNLKGQSVFLRLDLNMPFDGKVVRDTSRLDASMETLLKLKNSGAKTVIVTHLGRPKLKENELSTQKLLPLLEKKLSTKIHFARTLTEMKTKLKALSEGEFVLLENIRFWNEEERNNSEFAKKLASVFSIYVNEAFSVSHRAHASTHGVVSFIPLKVAGYHFCREVSYLSQIFDHEKRPLVAIIGGSKISTKIDLLENLFKICDFIFIGGAMANTFLVAKGALNDTASFYEAERVDLAGLLIKRHFHKIILPKDGVAVKDLKHPISIITDDIMSIPSSFQVVDMGPKSLQDLEDMCKAAKTIVWNGPVGVFEIPPFDAGSRAIGKILARLTKEGVTTIAGGGDTLAALGKDKDALSYVSTAGGAFLEWLEGRELPGVSILYRHVR